MSYEAKGPSLCLEYLGTEIKMQIPADFTKTLDYTSSLVDNGINGHLAQTHEAILEDSKGTQTLRQYKLYSDVMNTKIENIVSYMINTTTLHSF